MAVPSTQPSGARTSQFGSEEPPNRGANLQRPRQPGEFEIKKARNVVGGGMRGLKLGKRWWDKVRKNNCEMMEAGWMELETDITF